MWKTKMKLTDHDEFRGFTQAIHSILFDRVENLENALHSILKDSHVASYQDLDHYNSIRYIRVQIRIIDILWRKLEESEGYLKLYKSDSLDRDEIIQLLMRGKETEE